MTSVEFGYLPNLLGFRLKQANQTVLRESELPLRDLGITAQHFSILAMISFNPGIIQTRLIKNLYITRSTCSTLIDQLARSGLIARSPIDRRSFALSLTEKGKLVTEEARNVATRCDQKIASHLTKEETHMLLALLARLSEPPPVSSTVLAKAKEA